MRFFVHLATASYSPLLVKLESDFGLAALGFYWKAVEFLMLCGKRVPIRELQVLRSKPLRYYDVFNIIYTSGLFDIDSNFCVSLREGTDLGIAKKTLDSYFPGLCDNASTGTRDDADALDCTPACVRAVPNEIKEKEKEYMKKDTERDKEARTQLHNFFKNCCPHLLKMQEPLTLEQYRALKDDYKYKWNEIEDVLLQMENKVNLERDNRSCYETALNWLKIRRLRKAIK